MPTRQGTNFKRNQKTQKTKKRPRKNSNSNSNIPGVTYHNAGYKPPISRFNLAKGLELITQLRDYPIYIVSAHSCINQGSRKKEMFTIPPNTFILTFATPGECTFSNNTSLLNVTKQKEELRKYMHMTPGAYLSNHARKPSMFQGIHRARAGSTFPNIEYGLKEALYGDDGLKTGKFQDAGLNTNGVYAIDTGRFTKTRDFFNTNSVIPQDDGPDDPDYTLEQLIETVYDRDPRGGHRGIFILMGCLVPCKGSPSTDRAGSAMQIAHAEYETQNDTFDIPELESLELEFEIPVDYGINNQLASLDPAEAKKYQNQNLFALTNTRRASTYKQMFTGDNWRNTRKLLASKK